MSVDELSGARTSLVRWPSGRELTNACSNRSTEIYLLAGHMTIGGGEISRDGYAFLPANASVSINATAGTVALLMTGSRGDSASGEEQATLVDTYELPWQTGIEGSVTGKPLSPTIFTKKLRTERANGEQTFLYAALPHHAPPSVMPGKFTHPMVEEIFVLSGEYAFGDVGRMGPGGYVWWREDEYHGPAGSAVGYNLFIRIHEGPLENRFSAEPSPFSFEPQYRPALPAELQGSAAPYPFPPRW